MRIRTFSAAGALLLALVLSSGEAPGKPPRGKAKHLRLSPWETNAVHTLQTDRNPRDRVQALGKLARSTEERLIPLLAHYAAYDRDLSVRESASHAIARIRHHLTKWDPPPYPPLRNDHPLVEDEYRDDRRKRQEVQEAIDQLRTERRAYRREDAARTLGRIGGPGVIPLLAHAAAYDTDSTVRHVATRALERLQKQSSRWHPPDPPPYSLQSERPQPFVWDDDEPTQAQAPFGQQPWDSSADLIESAMTHYLRRRPSREEMNRWMVHFRRGGQYEQLLGSLIGSDEYFRQAGGDPSRYIVHLYNDVLRRQPTSLDMNVWLQQWRRRNGNVAAFGQQFVEASRLERSQKNLPY